MVLLLGLSRSRVRLVDVAGFGEVGIEPPPKPPLRSTAIFTSQFHSFHRFDVIYGVV